jgi:CubicO group peptidase (beta-lactamase class C family)
MIQNNLAHEIDELFKQWDKPDSPGCALAIIRDGKIIYKKGYGMADLEHDVPITPQTIFYVGSVSKQFTAMCILLLVEQNRVSLDDDIRKYLLKFPDYGQPITIRHLIHHTSGIRDYLALCVLSGRIIGAEWISIRDALNIIYRQKMLNFNPGEQYLYSASNYLLLAAIIKNVTGKSVREIADEYIFKPLNMKNTHFQDNSWEIIKNRAFCYVPDGKNGYFNFFITHDGSSSGSGGVFTNIEDFFLWDQNFYTNKLGKSDQNLVKTMQTTGKLKNEKELNYAFGLIVDKYKEQKRIWHVGGKGGYRALYLSFPEHNFSVIILCNFSNLDPESLALKISDIFLEKLLKPDKKDEEKMINAFGHTEASVDPKIFKNYIGEYMSESLGIVSISSENDCLMFKVRSIPKLELIPESETSFLLKALNVRITFEKDENDLYSQFILHQQGKLTGDTSVLPQDGKDLILKRIESSKQTQTELKEYNGSYFSEEINATFKILTENNVLYIYGYTNYAPKVYLTFFGKDKFLTNFGLFSFQRTENGIIEGFKLDTERVKNLWFKRR